MLIKLIFSHFIKVSSQIKAGWNVSPDDVARQLQGRRRRGHKDFKQFLKYLLISFVFIGFSNAWSGIYEDFFQAVERDAHSKVLELLLRGFDPNTVNPKGNTALMVAIQEPSPKVLQVLLGLDQTHVNQINRHDESALMLASLKGLEPAVRRLIERGADVNKTGWTPLHYAATGGHVGIMRLLFEHHAFVDPESPNGTTPLMMAARYGSSAAVKLLLEEGAVPTARNRLGLSALDFACMGERPDAISLLAPLMPGQPGVRDKRVDREAACAKPADASSPASAGSGAAAGTKAGTPGGTVAGTPGGTSGGTSGGTAAGTATGAARAQADPGAAPVAATAPGAATGSAAKPLAPGAADKPADQPAQPATRPGAAAPAARW
jgi:ankyrin repeat protein